jgi:isoquinoline 1-oxidoreductase subunit alpha
MEDIVPLTVTVNGKKRKVDVPPDTPLLWVLRDTLGLTGTKYGCGQGICGSCTVLVEGKALRSCVTQVSEVAGKKVVTVEGLGATELGKKLRAAWTAEQVPQCGYCQPGMLMTAAALLGEKPKPTDAEIGSAFHDHLCRCGTYLRVRRAVHRAAGPDGGVK